jgi:sulfur transfer complex TusBCD TusB component (DsrH family)
MSYHDKIEEALPTALSGLVLSPSSINLYRRDKALWVIKHFCKVTSETNIHALRGMAVEDGIVACLKGTELGEAIEKAVEAFNVAAFHFEDDIREPVAELIPMWITNALMHLSQHGLAKKISFQDKVSAEISGVQVSGYVDITETHGRLCFNQTDIKTVAKLPKVLTRGEGKGNLSADKRDNVRQQSFYALARPDHVTKLLFVSPDDTLEHVLTPMELERGKQELEETCAEIKNLLTLNIGAFIEATVPQWDKMNHNFYWDFKTINTARDIWWYYE